MPAYCHTKIFCISGKAGHGKDTFAKILEQKLSAEGYKVLIIHYADLLKFILKNFFRWNGEKDEHGRMLLQQVGTETVRKANPNYWVDFIASILSMFPREWDYVLIPDARFPNEIDRLKERGFDVTHVRVVRRAYESNLTDAQQEHSSETALDDVCPDVVIANDGTLGDLEETVIVCRGMIGHQEVVGLDDLNQKSTCTTRK